MARNGWTERSLGDLIEVRHGWPFKSKYFSEELTERPIVVNIGNFEYTGGFRFGTTTVKEYRDTYPTEYELSPGDILLVMTCQTPGGEILGIPARVPNDGRKYLHNQRLGKVVIKRPDEVNLDYLYWVFLWSDFNQELFATATGTKILHTAPSRIQHFRFRLPPLPTQRRIADILGTLDDKIELNRQMNETLETMARRLFKSWFIDFDPVHAKAALRRQRPKLSNAELSRRALPNMAPEIAELFPDSFEDSPLGAIPKGWKIARIDEVAIINGWTLSKKDELPVIDYIEISEVMRGDIRAISRFERGSEPSRARRRLRHGDVVLSTVRPDRGAYFIAIDPPETLIASTGFATVTSTDVPWSWTACALTSSNVFEYLGHIADGGAYPAVNPAIIGAIEFALPGRQEVFTAFHRVAADCLQLSEEHRRQSRRLAKTRDTLLPRLLSGAMSVSAARRRARETVECE